MLVIKALHTETSHGLSSLPQVDLISLKIQIELELCLTLCDLVDYSPQALLSMEFSRQEYRSGLPFLTPGNLPDPGIEHRSAALLAGSLPSEPPGKPEKPFILKVSNF